MHLLDEVAAAREFAIALQQPGRARPAVVVTIAAGWVDVANPVRLLISGTEGHALVVNDTLYFKSKHVEGADGQQPWTDLPSAWPHAFELFLDAVAGEAPPAGQNAIPLVTAQEAAFRSVVMEALYEGAKNGRWLLSPTQPKERKQDADLPD